MRLAAPLIQPWPPQCPFWGYLIWVSFNNFKKMWKLCKGEALKEQRMKQTAEDRHAEAGFGTLTVTAVGARDVAPPAGSPHEALYFVVLRCNGHVRTSEGAR